ncbi:hypothetical protein Nepgr_017634 [Nepenthes gracilis]|uniref:Pentatricopeptide repeat-containing protein n=1 Tax=Nepenthes gracilis TaxID=150966 RepID=A0AAD3XSN4_NEPGR|nr:hypothetical protein Nepgr_017634 [Nepenthes gracilis]
MAFLLRLRIISMHRRNYSTILNPDSNTIFTSKEKSRAAIARLKTEENPQRIIDICRAASLNPESHLDRVAFSVAISKLSKLTYFEGIRSLLEELKHRPDLRNERFVSHSIVLYGQAGMIQNAIDTFEQMDQLVVKRDVKSLNALLFACILKYDILPDLDTYNWVIKAFCESGNSSSGFSIIAEMDRNGCVPNATTFGTLIAGFYKEEKLEDVGKVLNLMDEHGIMPELGTYNIRIQSLCKLRRSYEAKSLVDGMLSRGMKPNSVSYSHLIHGFCKEGNLEEAKKLFKSMVSRGLIPDSQCYFTLVYFLCHGGDYETALQVCKESMEKKWVPNFTVMKSLVEGLVSISMVDEARELIRQIKKKFPKSAYLWKATEEELPKKP